MLFSGNACQWKCLLVEMLISGNAYFISTNKHSTNSGLISFPLISIPLIVECLLVEMLISGNAYSGNAYQWNAYQWKCLLVQMLISGNAYQWNYLLVEMLVSGQIDHQSNQSINQKHPLPCPTYHWPFFFAHNLNTWLSQVQGRSFLIAHRTLIFKPSATPAEYQ